MASINPSELTRIKKGLEKTSNLDDIKIRIVLVDPENWQNLDLIYDLNKTDIARKWANHIFDIQLNSHSVRESSIKHNCSVKIEDLYEKINISIDIINNFYDIKIKKFDVIDEEALNYLHECYEKYGERLQKYLDDDYWTWASKNISPNDSRSKVWPGRIFDESMHEGFIRLNELIHKIELVQSNSEANITGGIMTYSLWPREDFDLNEEDWESIVKYPNFGDLFLGYNTLGKNLEHIVLDQDHEAIERNAIIPQTNWSSELFANFNTDSDLEESNGNYLNSVEKYKKLWDDLQISEKTNYIFGEYRKNREGYIKIGQLTKRHREKYYKSFVENGYTIRKVLIDFNKFSSIYKVEVISKLTAESINRIPHWKYVPPNSGKKQTKVENTTNKITWILNNACTYNCRYCPPSLHTGDNTKWTWEKVEPFLNFLIKKYGPRTVYTLSGGEPTISPFFTQLIRRVHESGAITGITTNLSRTDRFIKENFGYLQYAACSFHPDMVFPRGESQEFIDKLLLAEEYCHAPLRVMMDPDFWDETMIWLEDIKNYYCGSVSLVWIQEQYGASTEKICDLKYTKEQNDFILNYKYENPNRDFSKNMYLKYSELNKEQQKPHDFNIHYSDGNIVKNPISQDLINRGETKYFDWNCYIGNESLFINDEGKIKRGNCWVGGNIGTIENFESIDWDSLERPIRCTEGWCQCGADVPISKVKMF